MILWFFTPSEIRASMPNTDDSNSNDGETSLDQLSQAFAEAMVGKPRRPDPITEVVDLQEGGRESQRVDEVATHSKPDANDACPISPQSVLEAILFVGHPNDAPITSPSVAKLLRGVVPGEIDALVVSLNEDYAKQRFPLRIESVGAGYRLKLSGEYDHVRQRFYGRIREARLSRAAVDVLAVVAYHQPVTRQFVDGLVGIDSGRILSQLIRRQLVAQHTPDEQLRKKQYVTTDRFLALFGLSHLHDLPRSDEPD